MANLTPEHYAAIGIVYRNRVTVNAPGGMGALEILDPEGEAAQLNARVLTELFEAQYFAIQNSRLILTNTAFDIRDRWY